MEGNSILQGSDSKHSIRSPDNNKATTSQKLTNKDSGDEYYNLLASGKEASNYDFAAARPQNNRTTVIESTANFIKGCLGAGIVAIHASYKQTGLWSAVILNVILAILITYLMTVLVRSAQRMYGRIKVPTLSYPDLAEAALQTCKCPKLRKMSKAFRFLVDATLMTDLFGTCCLNQVIMALTLQELILIGGDIHIHERILIGALTIPCMLICLILTLKYLAPFSIAADVILACIVVCTVVYSVDAATRSPLEYEVFKDADGLLQFACVCVFSLDGIGVALPIENSMKCPKKAVIVIWVGMTIVTSLTMIVGFFGYWGFGEKSEAPITGNFPKNTVSIVFQVGIIITFYVTFALNFWVPFNSVWAYIKRGYTPERYWITERVYRIVFVLVISIVGILFPDVLRLMGMLGAFCLSNLGFIFPAFIEIILDSEEPGFGFLKWRLLKFFAILIFGLYIMVVGTYSYIKEMIVTAVDSSKY